MPFWKVPRRPPAIKRKRLDFGRTTLAECQGVQSLQQDVLVMKPQTWPDDEGWGPGGYGPGGNPRPPKDPAQRATDEIVHAVNMREADALEAKIQTDLLKAEQAKQTKKEIESARRHFKNSFETWLAPAEDPLIKQVTAMDKAARKREFLWYAPGFVLMIGGLIWVPVAMFLGRGFPDDLQWLPPFLIGLVWIGVAPFLEKPPLPRARERLRELFKQKEGYPAGILTIDSRTFSPLQSKRLYGFGG